MENMMGIAAMTLIVVVGYFVAIASSQVRDTSALAQIVERNDEVADCAYSWMDL